MMDVVVETDEESQSRAGARVTPRRAVSRQALRKSTSPKVQNVVRDPAARRLASNSANGPLAHDHFAILGRSTS